MAVPVHFAARDRNGRITHLGGVGPNATTWQLTAAEVVTAIDSGEWLFLTQGPADRIALVQVRRNTNVPDPWLQSIPDGTQVNNLDALPPIVSPMGGAWPTSPMNYPSVVKRDVLRVQRARVRLPTGGTQERRVRQSVRVDPHGLLPLIDMTGVDRARSTRLPIDIRLPFPAGYFVNVLGDNGGISNLVHNGPGSEGWFTWAPGPSFFDNAGPHRIAEIRVVCAVPRWAWDQPAFTIEIGYISINPYARELLRATPVVSQLIRFTNIGPALSQPPAAPPAVAVPDCVGRTLQAAGTLVTAAGLRYQSFAADLLDGPPHTDWIVATQTPAPGTTTPVGKVIQLYARPTSPSQTVPGVKTVRVHNQYQQARPLQVWSRDLTAGTWTDEGQADFGGTPVTVDLADGHIHALFYADYALNSCRPASGYPPDLCVYRGPDGPAIGDDDGLTVDITITSQPCPPCVGRS